jgi:hypothetical protein
MSGVVIDAQGLDDLRKVFDHLPEIADQAAVLAVNDTARFARRLGAKQAYNEVRFPKGYLGNDTDGRLSVTKFASRGSKDPEALIKGRDRATSLARFAVTPVSFGRQSGVQVRVRAGGGGTQMAHAFYMRLRKGRTLEADNHNVGLAVRVKPGEKMRNTTGAMLIGDDLWLLYGPSVDQVFKGVAEDIVDETSKHLADEFVRQFERLQDARQ